MNVEFAEGGYTEFNAGGTHEENPNNGVQFGVNSETQEPMKAEEGEVMVGDYVFSNRIKPDTAILKVLGLPQKGELSYADIAKDLKKKLDKRPNDEIMKKYYDQNIEKLKQAQESTKRLREKAKENIIAQATQSLGLVPEQGENMELVPEGGEQLFAGGGKVNKSTRGFNPNPFPHGYGFGTKGGYYDKLGGVPIEEVYRRYKEDPSFHKDGKTKIYKWYDEDGTYRSVDLPEGLTLDEFAKKFNLDNKFRSKFWADVPFGKGTVGDQFAKDYPEAYKRLKGVYDGKPIKDEVGTTTTKTPDITKEVVKAIEETTQPSTRATRTRGNTTPKTSTNTEPEYARPLWDASQIRDARDLAFTPYNIQNNELQIPTVGIQSSTPQISSLSPNLGTDNKGGVFSNIWNKLSNFDAANLRYAPIVNAGINAFTDLIGTTNYDDFTTANTLENEYRRTFRNVAPELISGNLDYNPFDTDYAINRLQSQGAANRQAIINNSGGNRATATAGLLASDNNLMGNIGNEMIKAHDYNYQQRRQIADFDRQKDMFNAQQINNNYQINHSINSARMSGIERAAAMREQEKAINAQNRSINRNMFVDTMASLGREEQDRRFANVLTQYQIENNRIKYNKNK